ncbi:tetratricopeptide repeat protein [Egbenema bharatensis]|uniref:tetratricopeptide repeat protein n=1 Tax=Egbenema bharatensis TaxID=3463334 RepID=UPI003A8AF7F4
MKFKLFLLVTSTLLGTVAPAFAQTSEFQPSTVQPATHIAQSSSVIEQYGQALSSYNNRDNDRANELVNQILREDERFGPAYYLRGLLHGRNRRHQDAIADHTRALSLIPDDANQASNLYPRLAFDTLREIRSLSFYNRGLAYYELGNFQAAIEDLAQTTRLSPGFADGFYRLGFVQVQHNQSRAGLENLRRAAELAPNNLSIIAQYGISRSLVLGDYLTSIEAAARVLTLTPDANNPEDYWHLGQAHGTLGNLQEAEEAYTQAITIAQANGNSDYIRPYITRSDIRYAVGNIAGADEDFSFIINRNRIDDLWSSVIFSGIAFDLGAVSFAYDFLQGGFNRYPDNAILHIARGQLHFLRDDYVQAKADFDRAIALDPDFAVAYFWRSRTQPNPQAAISDLDRAISINPTYVEARIERGAWYAFAGDSRFQTDATEVDRLLNIARTNPGAETVVEVYEKERLGYLQRSYGEHPIAISNFRRAQQLYSQMGHQVGAERAELAALETEQLYLEGFDSPKQGVLRRPGGRALAEGNDRLDCQDYATSGQQPNNRLCHVLYYPARRNQTVSFRVISRDFDTYLYVTTPDGRILVENDDISPNNLNSEVTVTFPQDGEYLLIISSYDATGEGRFSLGTRVE